MKCITLTCKQFCRKPFRKSIWRSWRASRRQTAPNPGATAGSDPRHGLDGMSAGATAASPALPGGPGGKPQTYHERSILLMVLVQTM